MDADQQAGLAGLVMLVHDLLWWGGLAGALVLVRLSLVAARAEREGRPVGAAARVSPLPAGAVPFEGVAAGGRTSCPEATVTSASTVHHPRSVDRLLVVAGTTAAAAGVHAVMVLGHTTTGLLAPLFFAVVASAQAWQSWRLLATPSARLLIGVVSLDAALLLVWATSRTVGLLGPVEAVGPWDGAVVVWQTTCVVLGARLLRSGQQRFDPPPSRPWEWGVGTQTVLALTVLTLLLLPLGGH